MNLFLDIVFSLAAGHFLIIPKLKSLVPTLICVFKDLFSLGQSASSLGLNYFESMLSILRSIDIAVRFLISRSLSRKADALNCSHDLKLIPLDEPMTSMILRELLMLFPLHSNSHMSEKVRFPSC